MIYKTNPIKFDKRTRLERTKADVAQYDADVRAAYPDHADEARKLISKLLWKRSPYHARVFKGEIAANEDDDFTLPVSLHTVHSLVAGAMQNCERQGREVPPVFIESQVYVFLNLGFASIEGDAQ